MFQKKLEFIFLSIIAISLMILAKNYYDNYSYNNNEISDEYKRLIIEKEQEILHLMQQNYGFAFKVPLIISDEFTGRVYGVTSYVNGEIKIYLNKKVMRESMEYVIDSVIAHEYAHALMFKQGYLYSGDDGHSALWQQTCVKLGGVNCAQYVDNHDIVMGKLPF